MKRVLFFCLCIMSIAAVEVCRCPCQEPKKDNGRPRSVLTDNDAVACDRGCGCGCGGKKPLFVTV